MFLLDEMQSPTNSKRSSSSKYPEKLRPDRPNVGGRPETAVCNVAEVALPAKPLKRETAPLDCISGFAEILARVNSTVTMRTIDKVFEATIFMSRWLLAPFLVGMMLSVFLLFFRLLGDFLWLAVHVRGSTWHGLIVGVLNMIDLVLTANLVLLVLFSGYQSFIRKVEPRNYEGLPQSLMALNLRAVKRRLLGSIAVIAAIDALAWYVDFDKEVDHVRLTWVGLFPLIFAAAMVLLALADRMTDASSSNSVRTRSNSV